MQPKHFGRNAHTRRHRAASRGDRSWQKALREAFTRPEILLNYLGLDPFRFPQCDIAARSFRLRVPLSYARRIRKNDPNDPLLRQVLPLQDELDSHSGFSPDPVGDLTAVPAPGILYKYRGRALLIVTGGCAINCRYCFRRHFPYADNQLRNDRWTHALQFLAEHREIREVILSGGDPLILDDEELTSLTRALEAIPHLRRLRIHTRVPIALPERITEVLCGYLIDSRLKPIIVVQCNHPRELSKDVIDGLQALRETGTNVLNQSVLLRCVNDDVETLCALSEGLFDTGVIPYYLHLLDRVQGSAHFEVTERKALSLYQALRHNLPGYLVPRMVREMAGKPFKTPL